MYYFGCYLYFYKIIILEPCMMMDYVRTKAAMRRSELEQLWENQRNEIVSDWYEFIKIYIYNETYNRSELEYIINAKIKGIVDEVISLNIPVTLYIDDEKRLFYPILDFLWAEIRLSMESDGTMSIEFNDSAKLLFQVLGITQE